MPEQREQTDLPLRASLGEIAKTSAHALAEELAPSAAPIPGEALPSFDLPTDRPITTTRALAAELAQNKAAGVLHAAGAMGGATALVLRALSQKTRTRIIAITKDNDSARALAADASFLLGARDADDAEADGGASFGQVLLYLPNESSPYAAESPNRRGAQTRLSTLFHLAIELPWSVLVCPISALSRKVVPRDEVLEHADLLIAGQEINRDLLIERLTTRGYLRSPLCEDPGSLAVRGALLDVWTPTAELPVRIEFYGDLVMSIKSFDPEAQRTIREVPEVWLSPVREAILTPENVERARSRVRAACDAVDLPSSKTRTLLDDVLMGRSFFGSEGFLPAYVDLEALSSYLPSDALVVLEDPAACASALRDELGRATADEAQKNREPHFPLSAFYEPEARVSTWIEKRPVLCLHRSVIAGASAEPGSLERFEAADENTPSLGTFDQSDLERAIKNARASHGKTGALDPLVRRIEAWQEHGMRVVLAARAETQVERLTTLLRHRDLKAKARLGLFDPALLDDPDPGVKASVFVVVGSLARGVVAPAEGLVLVTEEEIFGARAHRRAARAQSTKATARHFLEDLRSLSVGDFVVHVEHGIGRYLGLIHKDIKKSRVTPSISSRSNTLEATSSICRFIDSTRSRNSRAARARPSWIASVDRPLPRPSRGYRKTCARWPTSSCASTPSAKPPWATRSLRRTTSSGPSRPPSPSTRLRIRRGPSQKCTRISRSHRSWTDSSAATSVLARPKSRCAPRSAWL